jgi:hypothetical protein
MTDTLCSLGLVLDACRQPAWSLERNQITLVVEKEVSLTALRNLEQFRIRPTFPDPQLQKNFDNEDEAKLDPGQTFILELPRILGENVVVETLSDLLAVDSATIQVPPAYFLIKEEESGEPFCYTGESSLETAPSRVVRYHQAIEFWNLIKRHVDTEKNDTLFLFGLERTEIKPGFLISDLASEIALDQVSRFVIDSEKSELPKPDSAKSDSEKPDSETPNSKEPDSEKYRVRRQIFRSVLSEFLDKQSSENAFAYLLRESTLFAQRLNEGWNVYIFSLSPKKLNQEAITKHLKLTEQLEKIIGGMEAKSLTIPAAVLFAVKEVQFSARWTTLNTIILTASVLYLLAMTVAHISQRSTLKLVKRTITKTIGDLKDQGLDGENVVLTDSFVNLESRRRNSAYGSWAMFIFSFVPLIAVIYAAFFASPRS